MRKIRWYSIFLMAMIAVTLASCGGGGGGGGGGDVGAYDTVILSADAPVNLDSDVATWEDGDGDGFVCGAGDTYTIFPDDITISINSETIPNLPDFVTPSRVRLEQVKITYTPADGTSPPLAARYETIGLYVDAGGSLDVPIRVVSIEQKASSPLSDLVCSGTIYSYYVKLKFEGVEVISGKEENFSTTMNVRFTDFLEL